MFDGIMMHSVVDVTLYIRCHMLAEQHVVVTLRWLVLCLYKKKKKKKKKKKNESSHIPY
jgi:hypothetical protein